MADETESPWIALAPIRWGDRWIKPGEPVPAGENGRNYELLRRTGQIAYRDGVQAAPVAAPVAYRLHDEYLPKPPAEAAQQGREGAGEPEPVGSGGEGGTGTGGEGGGSGAAAGPEPAAPELSESMTLAELGAIAESYGLPSSGSKAQIITRVQKHLETKTAGEGAGA